MTGYRDATLTPDLRAVEADVIEAWVVAKELAYRPWPAWWRLLARHLHYRSVFVAAGLASQASADLNRLRRRRGLPPSNIARLVVRSSAGGWSRKGRGAT